MNETMDLKNRKVLCSGKIREIAFSYIKDKVDLCSWQEKGRMPKDKWDSELAVAEALYSTGNIRIDAKLLDKAPNLKVIAQASVGYDNVDVAACRERGILFGNTPGVLVNAVADLSYGLIIDSARGIVRGHAHVKDGLWEARKGLGMAVDLFGKTLGIVGMGDIGSAVVTRAKASGMKVIYHNRHRKLNDDAIGAAYRSFDALLSEADFILVAVDLNPSTLKMFDAAAFAKMKDGVRFINISRGKVVDTEALLGALESGKVAAVGLDVTDPEPLPHDHPLLQYPQVTVTPHIASATVETRDNMALLTVENILAGLSGNDMPARVK